MNKISKISNQLFNISLNNDLQQIDRDSAKSAHALIEMLEKKVLNRPSHKIDTHELQESIAEIINAFGD